MSKIEMKRGKRTRLVLDNPNIDGRAASSVFQKGSPTHTGVVSLMEKFADVTETALHGDYDYREKLAYAERQLEQLRIDLLNFNRIKAQDAA